MKDIRCVLRWHSYELQCPDGAAWPYFECRRCQKFKHNLHFHPKGQADPAISTQQMPW